MKNLAQPSPSPRLGGVCVTLSAVALVLFRSVSNAQQNEPRNVSVCQLVDSPKEFNGKYVRVRAQVSSDGIERTNLKDDRSEEHTSELQSRGHLVCRLLLEKKKTEQ